MPDDSTVRCELDGAVATLSLNRPDALNAITPAMLDELGDRLDDLAQEKTIRVIVVTGEGRAFSAGVDLKALGGRSLDGGSVGDVLDVPARRVIKSITTMPKIVVAKVNGHAFTGALELILACDVAFVAHEARLGDTHAKFGLRPTWGMSQRLIRTVGVSRARELSYTARTFTGTEAAAWGLAVRAVPRAELDETVSAVVAEILANSDGSLRAYKDLYRYALDGGLDRGLSYEAETSYSIADTDERVADFR